MKAGWRKGIVVMVLILAVALFAGSFWQKEQQKVYSRDIFAMDTYFVIRAYGPYAGDALALCEQEVQRLEQAFSVTDANSDVARLNRGECIVPGEDTGKLLGEALRLCEATNGALDISLYPILKEWGFTTGDYQVPEAAKLRELLAYVDYRELPAAQENPDGPGNPENTDNTENSENRGMQLPKGMEIDLGAVAKGYTGDCLIEQLRSEKVSSAILDLGGNIQVLGTKPDGSDWRVAVKNPFDPAKQIGVVAVSDKAVITSGGYERFFEQDGKTYWHILDPQTGYPSERGLLSVTVVGDRGVECDGLSTALFVMGTEDAVEYWRGNARFEMILVTVDGRLLVTEGLQDSFTCSEEWNAEFIYRDEFEK